MKDDSGNERTVKSQKEVDSEIFKFYQNLYKDETKNVEEQTIEAFLEDDSSGHKKVPENMVDSLEGEITVEEATRYIKKCRKDASPGSDGFTGNFFVLFWRNLKSFIVESLNYAYKTGHMSISQKLGVIILLPKPGKDKSQLTNWRPISLLNQIYKILSGVLTERLKPTLEHIIHTGIPKVVELFLAS